MTSLLILSLSAALAALYAPDVPSTTIERLITAGFGVAATDYLVTRAPPLPIESAAT